jgi:hypothetical protein
VRKEVFEFFEEFIGIIHSRYWTDRHAEVLEEQCRTSQEDPSRTFTGCDLHVERNIM